MTVEKGKVLLVILEVMSRRGVNFYIRVKAGSMRKGNNRVRLLLVVISKQE